MNAPIGAVDYWCNAFTPDRRAAWETAIADQGLALKVTRPTDDFCSPEEMVDRMAATGFATLVLTCCDEHPGSDDDFPAVATRVEEMRRLHDDHSAALVATWSIDPRTGSAGVRRAAEILDEPWCVGLHVHTHSWDRRLDHADYYPYYALAAAADVPFVAQVGASGGRFPSECGRPAGVDRPAIYFPEVRFVLSHTGWPWTTEAIAMAMKFSNVFLGTATWPPARWAPELLDFIQGSGRDSCLYGTGFPTTGHHQAAEQLARLDLDPDVLTLLTTRNARRVFGRLGGPTG